MNQGPEVRFYFIRHGEKDASGNMTEKGIEQVRAAAQHLPDYALIAGVYASELPRAVVAARTAVATYQGYREDATSLPRPYEPIALEQFGYARAVAEYERHRSESVAFSEDMGSTVADFLNAYPPALTIRHIVTLTMEQIAGQLAKEWPHEKAIMVPVGSHQLVGEVAAFDPAAMPMLGLGDIAAHILRPEEGKGYRICQSLYLPNPLGTA